jgi:hypothetical protein
MPLIAGFNKLESLPKSNYLTVAESCRRRENPARVGE